MKLVIDNFGDVHGVYDDRLVALNLGAKEVSRASHVEFNNQYQIWEASLTWMTIFGPFREAVLAMEKQFVESCILDELTT